MTNTNCHCLASVQDLRLQQFRKDSVPTEVDWFYGTALGNFANTAYLLRLNVNWPVT